MAQRGRSYHDPSDLGIYSRTSIRFIKGRIGAENKGQSPFRSTNDGTSGAFQNVWFQLSLTKPGYLILLKENSRHSRFYNISVYSKDQERRQLSYPVQTGRKCDKFNNIVAGTSSDLYNIIDTNTNLVDQNRTSLLPLPKGTYVINISTQRWDAFHYGVYVILEMPRQTGLIQFETFGRSIHKYPLQEVSSLNTPYFFLLENTVAGILQPVRERIGRDERELRIAWNDLTGNQSFPQEILDYICPDKDPFSSFDLERDSDTPSGPVQPPGPGEGGETEELEQPPVFMPDPDPDPEGEPDPEPEPTPEPTFPPYEPEDPDPQGPGGGVQPDDDYWNRWADQNYSNYSLYYIEWWSV